MAEYDYSTAIRKGLAYLKERYWRPVIAYPGGHLCHFGHCHVHLPIEIYNYAPCTCGFNLDLQDLCTNHRIAKKLNPELGNQGKKQETGVFFEGRLSREEANAFLKKAFNCEFTEPDPEEVAAEDEEDWNLIEEFFGVDYVTILKSLQHDTECPTCGCTYLGDKDRQPDGFLHEMLGLECRYCKSIEAYKQSCVSAQ